MYRGRRFTNDAERRARSLLLSVLTPEERDQWEREQRVVVTGSAGGQYLVQNGSVHRWKDGDWSFICVHTRGEVLPWPDRVAAIILAIKSNERKFRVQMTPGSDPWGAPILFAAAALSTILLLVMAIRLVFHLWTVLS
jgi:hypothetical protein